MLRVNAQWTSTTLYILLTDRVNKNTFLPNELTQSDVAAVWPNWLQETYFNSQTEAIATSLRHPIHLHASGMDF